VWIFERTGRREVWIFERESLTFFTLCGLVGSASCGALAAPKIATQADRHTSTLHVFQGSVN
jgi:hypothetical protein